jgi:NADH:ubiquinone oxidoreductase subunit 3 (subunit A)
MPIASAVVVSHGLAVALVIAAVVVAVLLIGLFAVMFERLRRNRRFSKKLSRYERRRMPGEGQVLDPNDRPGRR